MNTDNTSKATGKDLLRIINGAIGRMCIVDFS